MMVMIWRPTKDRSQVGEKAQPLKSHWWSFKDGQLLATGYRNMEAASSHVRAVWWRSGAKVPLESFPKRMGGKKLEIATINKFQKIYYKGKKRNVVEACSRGKWAQEIFFYKTGEITVCFYDSRNYPAERKIKIMQETGGRLAGTIFSYR